MKGKKYLLKPGYIPSENDGDLHYVSPVQLKNLYQVPMNECLIFSGRTYRLNPQLIILQPQYDGNYTIPKDNNE